MNFVGEKTGASQVFLLLLGLRELLVGLIALVIVIQGSDEVCRSVVTLTFIILSPAQLYTMATSDFIQDDARMQLVIFQAIFAFYLSLAVLICWSKKYGLLSSGMRNCIKMHTGSTKTHLLNEPSCKTSK
jgi:uncharacterized membrane protein